MVNLVDSVEFGEAIEDGVHGVEHADYFHGRDAAANLREAHHVREEDRHAIEDLFPAYN